MDTETPRDFGHVESLAMSLRQFRFTIRRLMLVVAAVALILTAILTPVRLYRLRWQYRAVAAHHAVEERIFWAERSSI